MKRSRATAFVIFVLLSCLPPQASAKAVSITHGELELLAELQLADNSTLRDGVLLIVHGTLAHHGMELIATMQSLLLERGFNTLAITLSLGQSARQGMFDCAAPHTHRHHDAVAEIDRWMDWLKAREVGPVLLIGHSRGGNQAARYAVGHASRVRALALVAPATYDASRAAAAYEKRYAVALTQVLERAHKAAASQLMDGVGFLYCPAAQVSAEAFLSYYVDDAMHDTPSLLPTIMTPTLVIAGGADQTVADVPARTKAHLGDTTRLIVIDDADHFFRDLYAEDLADALADFAGQHLR